MSDEAGRRVEATDEFEAGMETRGQVIHRDKKVSRSMALLMLVCTVGFLAASIGYAFGWGADVPMFAKVITFVLTPLFPYVLLTGTVVRTVVTSEELHIQWGMRGPRIPIDAITRCERLEHAQLQQVPREFTEKHSRKQLRLFAPGAYDEAIWLEWSDGDGTAHGAMVAADHPGALAAAIQDARSKGGGLRVQTDTTGEDESEEEMAAPEEETREASEPRSGATQRLQ